MNVISFVAAASNSGKTTLIEKIVRILRARGMRVAVVKHAPKGFDAVPGGKDSSRFRAAGADPVLVVGPDSVVLQRSVSAPLSEDEMRALLGDADIAIREGFRSEGGKRIEVFRHGVSGERPLCQDDHTFLALAADKAFPGIPVPQFDIDDAEALADFLLEACGRLRG